MENTNDRTRGSVLRQLLFYPITFYSISFAGYVLYFIQGNPSWFDVAYASNLGGLFMNIVVLIVLIIQKYSKQRYQDNLLTLRMVFNSLAILLFGGNALALLNQLGRSQPLPGIAPWIAGVALMSIVFPELLTLSLQKNGQEQKTQRHYRNKPHSRDEEMYWQLLKEFYN